MTDDPDPGPGPRRDGDRPPGSIRPVSPVLLAVLALVGLVVGRLLQPLAVEVGTTAPVVTWPQPAVLAFVAVALARFAWDTHRAVQVRHERLEPHRAVNRLAFGRAAAYVGSVVAGGYAGYALSWLGSSSELAGARVLWSGVAALAAVAVVVGGVLLERACRVRGDDQEP